MRKALDIATLVIGPLVVGVSMLALGWVRDDILSYLDERANP